MTKIELQSQIQRKAQELPLDLLQEVYDYMEFILEKRKRKPYSKIEDLENWWQNISNFSGDFMEKRIQPPLDKNENLFE
ncbi:DUF2281 domain-containing protein [Dyadobacter chenhuakuii]|uniref:DUF2281 domain-containing protein n=1 Tax=Dyadobacter chenhuakuii TaxID=2909339 RepID=A0A9X1QGQ8_9BACT|nr:DUF2281 domain-containing protein [Dyadobacter chenhuakuii]MCF2500187.1 DUF2281 domain-containing protein [Dyadobacter chenhuakuii]